MHSMSGTALRLSASLRPWCGAYTVCHLRMAILTTFQSMHASSHALHNAMLSICRKGLMGT